MDALFEFALLVKAAQRELERRVNEAMQPLGLTAAQADALVVIGQAEPLSLKDLGELLIAEAGHPSRLVDRLVEAGLVQRRAAGDDRRRIELSLTFEGRKLEDRIFAAREQIRELARVLIGDRDFRPTVELLRHLLKDTPLGNLVEHRRELPERRTGDLLAASQTAGRRLRKRARASPSRQIDSSARSKTRNRRRR